MIEIIKLFSPFLFFFVALFLLIKSADFFVNFAERLGAQLKVPHFIIGFTIVAIGTSLPELATSIATIIRSTPDNDLTSIVSSNIIGSNIANILLGIGIASLFRTIKVKREIINVDLPLLFASTTILAFFLWDGVLTRPEGIALLAIFLIFLAFSVFGLHEKEDDEKKSEKNESIIKLIFFIILSGIVIAFSSDFTIKNLEIISVLLGIPASLASMFFLALGTSFPEIFVGVVMVRKGLFAMALGNILGSNITNTLAIMGISAVLYPIAVSAETISIGIPFIIIATLFFIFAGMDKIFPKWEGMIAISIYIIFVGKIFGLL